MDVGGYQNVNNCAAAPTVTANATITYGSPMFGVAAEVLVVGVVNRVGHWGSVRILPYVLAIQSTTPFVHPNPS